MRPQSKKISWLGPSAEVPSGHWAPKTYHIRNWSSWSDAKKLKKLREISEEYGRDPEFRAWVIQNVCQGTENRDFAGQARRILSWVQNNVRYFNEPNELIQSPQYTIRKGFGDCFSEGTLVLRDDYELIPIERVEPGQKIWGKDRWSTVEAWVEKGEMAVDRVTLNNGSSFAVTPGHKVYVYSCEKHGPKCPDIIGKEANCRGRKKEVTRILVSELEEGMQLLTPESIDCGEKHEDPALSLLKGLYLADGWREDQRFFISGKDGFPKEAQKKQVARICQEWGLPTRWHERYIAVNSKELAEQMGPMGTHAWDKRVSSLNLCEESAEQLLLGLMADAGKNASGSYTFTSTSQMLALQFRLLNKMMGKSCGAAYIEKHGGLGKHPVWRMTVRQELEKRATKRLRVKLIEREVETVPCYDITTDDHYVYLPEADVTVSNCDDSAVLMAAMLHSIAIPWNFVLAGKSGSGAPVRWSPREGTTKTWGKTFYHIYVEAGLGRPLQWVSMEPTIKGAPLGYDVVKDGISADKNGQPILPELSGAFGDTQLVQQSTATALLSKLSLGFIAIGIVQSVISTLILEWIMRRRKRR